MSSSAVLKIAFRYKGRLAGGTDEYAPVLHCWTSTIRSEEGFNVMPIEWENEKTQISKIQEIEIPIGNIGALRQDDSIWFEIVVDSYNDEGTPVGLRAGICRVLLKDIFDAHVNNNKGKGSFNENKDFRIPTFDIKGVPYTKGRMSISTNVEDNHSVIKSFKFQSLKKYDFVNENNEFIDEIMAQTMTAATFPYSEEAYSDDLYFESSTKNLEGLHAPFWEGNVSVPTAYYWTEYSKIRSDEHTVANMAKIILDRLNIDPKTFVEVVDKQFERKTEEYDPRFTEMVSATVTTICLPSVSLFYKSDETFKVKSNESGATIQSKRMQIESFNDAIRLGGGDCIPEYEKIITKNFPFQMIKDVQVGDDILSYDFKTKKTIHKKVTFKKDKGVLDIYKITFNVNIYISNNELTIDVTENHPLWARVYKGSQKTSTFSKVLMQGENMDIWKKRCFPVYRNGIYSELTIKSIVKLPTPCQTYDIEVEDTHAFIFSNGVIGHNCEDLAELNHRISRIIEEGDPLKANPRNNWQVNGGWSDPVLQRMQRILHIMTPIGSLGEVTSSRLGNSKGYNKTNPLIIDSNEDLNEVEIGYHMWWESLSLADFQEYLNRNSEKKFYLYPSEEPRPLWQKKIPHLVGEGTGPLKPLLLSLPEYYSDNNNNTSNSGGKSNINVLLNNDKNSNISITDKARLYQQIKTKTLQLAAKDSISLQIAQTEKQPELFEYKADARLSGFYRRTSAAYSDKFRRNGYNIGEFVWNQDKTRKSESKHNDSDNDNEEEDNVVPWKWGVNLRDKLYKKKEISILPIAEITDEEEQLYRSLMRHLPPLISPVLNKQVEQEMRSKVEPQLREFQNKLDSLKQGNDKHVATIEQHFIYRGDMFFDSKFANGKTLQQQILDDIKKNKNIESARVVFEPITNTISNVRLTTNVKVTNSIIDDQDGEEEEEESKNKIKDSFKKLNLEDNNNNGDQQISIELERILNGNMISARPSILNNHPKTLNLHFKNKKLSKAFLRGLRGSSNVTKNKNENVSIQELNAYRDGLTLKNKYKQKK